MIRKTKEIDKLQKQLKQAKKQAQEHLEGWKRAQADFINYKKQQEKRIRELIEYANEGLILEILPIVEGFEQAIQEALEQEDSVWLEGVKKIKQSLDRLLGEKGLERIETKGIFNHELHEAVERQAIKKLKPGTIIKELSPGYKLGIRVIRPAKVKVAK